MVYKVRWTLDQQDRFIRRWLRFREKYGLTQEQMAQGLGIHVNTVNRIERGKFVPREGVVLKFAELEKKFKDGERIAETLAWVPGEDEI